MPVDDNYTELYRQINRPKLVVMILINNRIFAHDTLTLDDATRDSTRDFVFDVYQESLKHIPVLTDLQSAAESATIPAEQVQLYEQSILNSGADVKP